MSQKHLRAGLVSALGLALVAGPLVVAPASAAPTSIQILTINDFHGRLEAGTGIPGAAVLAGAVDSLTAGFAGGTAFVSAGDNIGASPFVSAVQQDAPTIDVLNEMGLAVSAVGNHEFDRGYGFLSDPATVGVDGTGAAAYPILGANVEGESPNMPASEVVDVGGVAVGFVGVVTEQTPSLVAAGGIPGITFTDPVVAANTEADRLVDNDLADVVVLLAHEGGDPSATDATSCATLAARGDAFSEIVTGANANVAAIVGGHTHLAVDCDFPKPGSAVTRPVVEANSYSTTVGRLQLTVDPDTGVVSAASGDLVDVMAGGYTADPAVQAIVDEAAAEADVVGSVEVGELAADIARAKNAAGEEDRGAESALGNFIADVQLDATSTPELGGAQIALMNPGGLRADFTAGDVTYSEAADVQPFANGLVTLSLTGAQVKAVLEEQWQTNPGGAAPSRPFLALGLSQGFSYTYDPAAAQGSHVVTVTLDGVALDPAATYRVTVNSFLATGGDNFRTLAAGTARQDNGFNDLNVLVDYLAANDPVSAAQIAALVPRRSIAVPVPPTAPPVAAPAPTPTPGTGGRGTGRNPGLSVDTGVTTGTPSGQLPFSLALLLVLSAAGTVALRRRRPAPGSLR